MGLALGDVHETAAHEGVSHRSPQTRDSARHNDTTRKKASGAGRDALRDGHAAQVIYERRGALQEHEAIDCEATIRETQLM